MSEYLSSFNAGQLSPLLDSRKDLDVYQSGCKILRNFYVKPQGGVERRQGSQYLLESLSDKSRLIPFIFTRDVSYMVELDESGIRIIDGDGEVIETIDSPYDATDIPDIKYTQVSDIMWMVCPNKKPYQLKRTNINPITFVLDETPFTYPPLLSSNTDIESRMYFQPLSFDDTLDYAENSQVQESGVFYTNPADVTAGAFNTSEWNVFTEETYVSSGSKINMYSNTGEFHDGIQDGYFRVSHQRASEIVLSEGEYYSPTYSPVYSDWVYIGDTGTFNEIDLYQKRDWLSSTTDIQVKDGINGTITTLSSHTHSGNVTIRVDGVSHTYCRLKMNTSGIVVYKGDISYTITKYNPIRVSFTSNNAGITQSDELDVSFSNWTITTSDNWTGSVEIEKSVDGGGIWNTLTKVIDTAGMSTTAGETSNVTFTSPSKEGANTKIRIKFHWSFGTIKCVLENDTIKSEGLLRINEYIDEHNVVATVLNTLLNNHPTSSWSEGAFNSYRGYPCAITELQNRIVYSGTTNEPNTVYMSYVDDYHNFLLGTHASDPIKVTPNTNEPTNWLLTKSNVLYQGTRGAVVTYTSYDKKALSPSNVSATTSLTFGGSTIQGILSNETVLFLERLNLKLREAFYSDEESGLVSRDLTALSNEIAGDFGFTELVLQKTPDQIIYGLRKDGLLSGLTYERSQDVIGWSIFDFGGSVTSIGVRPTGTHDELWLNVKRTNGSFIEKTGSRLYSDDLNDAWYVDSGISQGGTVVDDVPISIGDTPNHEMMFTVDSDTMSIIDNGMILNINSTDTFTQLDGQTYEIADINRIDNTFYITHPDTADKVNAVVDFMPSSITLHDVIYTLNGYNTSGYPIFISSTGGRIEGGIPLSSGAIDITEIAEIDTFTSTIKYEWFSSTGTHYCRVVDINNDNYNSISIYSLTTPYDTTTKIPLSTAVYDFKNVCSVCLKDDGSRIYISYENNTNIYQYDLETTWMIDTRENLVVDGFNRQVRNMQWNNDGTKFVIGGYEGAYIIDTAYISSIYENNPFYHHNPDYLYNISMGFWVESFRPSMPSNKKHTWCGMFGEDNIFVSTHIKSDGTTTCVQEWATDGFSFATTPTITATEDIIDTYTRVGTYGGKLWCHYVYGIPATGTTGVYNISDDTVVNKWTIEDGEGNMVDIHSDEWFYPPKTGWDVSPSTIIVYDGDISLPLTADISYISKTWTGLDHLNDEIVSVQGDGAFAGSYLVENGRITTDEYYNSTIIGLRYISMIQPMFINTALYNSDGYKKNILSTVFRFYRSLGGYSGIMIQSEDRDPIVDFEELANNFPDIDRRYYEMEPFTFRKYNDPIGSVIKPFTGTKEVNYNDTSSRVKTQFIITDDPLPMTVQSMTVDLHVSGD